MAKRQVYLVLLFSLVSMGMQAFAVPGVETVDPASLLGARSNGRGGATTASNTTHDSVFQNPAGSAFTKQYVITVGYQGAGDALAASVVDTKSGPLGGSLYYYKRDFRSKQPPVISFGDALRSEERAGLALFGRASEAFALGVSAKYVYRRSRNSVYGNAKNWNGDVGARYQVSPQLTLGVVGQNMLEDLTGLNPKNLLLGVEFVAAPGVQISAQVSRLLIDGLSHDVSFGLGGEYLIGSEFKIRAGYEEKRPWEERFAAAGLGYETKDFALDYSVQIPLKGKGDVIHSLSLSGYL